VQPDPSALLRDIAARSHDVRRRAEALQAELRTLEESVTSPDRLVTVTVGAGGVMRAVQVEASGMRATPTQWSDAVMRAYGEGCRRVGLRAAEIVQQHTPGSPAAQLMRDAVPPADGEEQSG
jgi:DNA-binding protein YbaB